MLPRALQQAIQEQAAAIPAPLLALASARQAELYSGADPDRAMRIESAAARLAYLAARMPPIFQVVQLLCAELARRYRRLEIHSVLDLGCGPATATLAAHECFEITSASLIDRDGEWFGIARRMLAAAGRKLAAGARFTAGDLDAAAAFEPHDLAIISYAIGEMDNDAAGRLVRRAWQSARRAMIIVEPGTPRGYGAMLAARRVLIGEQARIVAPCPHTQPCPLADRDWCHFDTRVQRTPLHRRIKGGSLPYEIEKYSYVIAARELPTTAARAARIIRRPLKKSGHVILDLCTATGAAQRVVIPRRDKQAYRRARDAAWGGIWKAADDAANPDRDQSAELPAGQSSKLPNTP